MNGYEVHCLKNYNHLLIFKRLKKNAEADDNIFFSNSFIKTSSQLADLFNINFQLQITAYLVNTLLLPPNRLRPYLCDIFF